MKSTTRSSFVKWMFFVDDDPQPLPLTRWSSDMRLCVMCLKPTPLPNLRMLRQWALWRLRVYPLGYNIFTDVKNWFYPRISDLVRSPLNLEWISSKHHFLLTQAWTGHCAIVPWHRRPPPLRRTQARPLAPSKFFDVCVTEKKIYYRCGPLPTPLVVMITKLSLIGIPSKNSISLWLVALSVPVVYTRRQ